MTIRVFQAARRDERFDRALKIAGIAVVGTAAIAAAAVFLARDQMVRHRRDLFSAHPLRRLAALGYIRSHPNPEDVMLLRDFLAWEDRPLLRKRATGILESLEQSLAAEKDAAS